MTKKGKQIDGARLSRTGWYYRCDKNDWPVGDNASEIVTMEAIRRVARAVEALVRAVEANGHTLKKLVGEASNRIVFRDSDGATCSIPIADHGVWKGRDGTIQVFQTAAQENWWVVHTDDAARVAAAFGLPLTTAEGGER